MTIQEIDLIASQIVTESKATAKVDQGTLRRSISYTIKNDEVIFREMNYGKDGDNSYLIENAKKLMPSGSKYKFEFIDVNGDIVEVTKTKSGRTSRRNINKILKSNGVVSTNNAMALINKLRKANENKDRKSDNKK